MYSDWIYNMSNWEIKTLSKVLPFPQLWQGCGLLKFAFFPVCTLNMSKIYYKKRAFYLLSAQEKAPRLTCRQLARDALRLKNIYKPCAEI